MKRKSNLIYRTTSVLVMCMSLPHAAMSADSDGNYALRGIGSASCNSYTEALANETARAQAFIGWTAGYITARSRMTEDTFDVLPLISGADVAGLMRVICTQNADTSFEVAVDAALDLFYPARVKVDSPLLELKHNGQTVAVREVTLAQVQAVLSERGFYESDVDGAYGPATRAAVQRFQALRNLKETGLPDADTLIALLLAE